MDSFCLVFPLYPGVMWGSLVLSLLHLMSMIHSATVIFGPGPEYPSLWSESDRGNMITLGEGTGRQMTRSYILIFRAVWSVSLVVSLPLVFTGLKLGQRGLLIPAMIVCSLSSVLFLAVLHFIYNMKNPDAGEICSFLLALITTYFLVALFTLYVKFRKESAKRRKVQFEQNKDIVQTTPSAQPLSTPLISIIGNTLREKKEGKTLNFVKSNIGTSVREVIKFSAQVDVVKDIVNNDSESDQDLNQSDNAL